MTEQELKDAIVREAMWWWEMIRPFAGPKCIRWVDVKGNYEDETNRRLDMTVIDLAAELDELERSRGHARWSLEDLAEIRSARGHYQDELQPEEETV
jgi:hypothetical protein